MKHALCRHLCVSTYSTAMHLSCRFCMGLPHQDCQNTRLLFFQTVVCKFNYLNCKSAEIEVEKGFTFSVAACITPGKTVWECLSRRWHLFGLTGIRNATKIYATWNEHWQNALFLLLHLLLLNWRWTNKGGLKWYPQKWSVNASGTDNFDSRQLGRYFVLLVYTATEQFFWTALSLATPVQFPINHLL